jgi:hypothetical protein
MKKALVFAWLLVGHASAADAQSFFVDGTLFAGIERRAHAETNGGSSFVAGLDGTVAGGGATIGAWLTPQVSARLEMSFPAGLESSSEESYPIILPVDVSLPSVVPPWVVRTDGYERTRTFAALLAYHTARRHRVQLGYIGGAAFLVSESRETVSIDYPTIAMPPGLSVIPDPSYGSSRTEYGVTVAVGLDADVSLASHFSVVPQLRVVGFNGGVSVRPGVAVRASW